MSKKEQKQPRRKAGTANDPKGILEITRSGLGFVVMPGDSGDILVRPGNFNSALNGDTVRVEVTKENDRNGKREGRIVEVLTRKQNEFVGHIQLSTNYAFFVPDTDKPMPDLYIPLENLNGAKNKERVIARITNWENGSKKPEGTVVQVIHAEDESNIAMKEILAENGFPLEFPDEVLEEAERLPDIIGEDEISKRKDFRDVLTFTIDPVDARDFDDALSIKKLTDDLYEIGVHIADVSHFVVPETELDKEGYHRATSVYLPDRVNPMLPERISNELCSLRPHEDKLTFSAVFEMNTKGEISRQWLGRTVIHSNHRFTYEDVQQIIETKQGPHENDVLLLNTIAQTLRSERFRKGAINFSSTEVRFKLDEKGKPVGIVVKESKESHQLIEEFMLLANKAVAETVSKVKVRQKDIPFSYRVHDRPDEQKLAPFIAFATKFGHRFDISSPENIASSFNAMLEAVKGKPEQHVLEQLGIRTMAKAFYTTENIGHYGLGFENYCHFTSPIRRYPDILVHRVLESVLQKKPVIDKKMEEKNKHCSEQERNAMDAERAGNKYKQVEFLKDHLGEEFEGVVSGVAGFGFWVETVEHKCEGLVTVTSLIDYDDFRLVEGDYALVGRRSGRKFRMGDRVTIRVVAANLTKRQLDFEWVIKAGLDQDERQAPESISKPRGRERTGVPAKPKAGTREKSKRKKKE
ncbi:ribonuclease R [Segetibacter sp. 3557_3]|uniref:ribonuclease R n=1 Tax=Segetibacter sp. 3557_3 TaxID=2547429 RepID=UPI00105845AF|nr:ribonuclease R [Segetibacter sp. 3557_3]TDH29174.1 ribonuclease R [Segetibacter sp. 3557_3]